jgi:hypothetical protein
MVLRLISSLFGSDVTWPVSGGRGRGAAADFVYVELQFL